MQVMISYTEIKFLFFLFIFYFSLSPILSHSLCLFLCLSFFVFVSLFLISEKIHLFGPGKIRFSWSIDLCQPMDDLMIA